MIWGAAVWAAVGSIFRTLLDDADSRALGVVVGVVESSSSSTSSLSDSWLLFLERAR